MKPVVIALPGNEYLLQSFQSDLEFELGELEIHRFPDGETYVRLNTNVENRSIVLIETLASPDDKILPLLFTAATAKELGASSIGLVAPYLAYMRQDRRFQPGEGITSSYFGTLISRWIDWLVTVDPHLHRRTSLREIFTIPADVLHAAPLISNWIREHVDLPLIVGPDSESEQWVSQVAQKVVAPFMVLEKIRRGDHDVEVSVPKPSLWPNHTPVLVDDIISTGSTMVETAGHLRAAGLAPPVCIGVHAIFAGRAHADMTAAGIERIVTCNTIPHESNAIDIGEMVAAAVAVRHVITT